MSCAHHFIIESEPDDPDVMVLTGTCKLCGAEKQWPRKIELQARELTFRGYRRTLGPDHLRGMAIGEEND